MKRMNTRTVTTLAAVIALGGLAVVGHYTVVGTVNDINYAGSATDTFVITAIPCTMIILQ